MSALFRSVTPVVRRAGIRASSQQAAASHTTDKEAGKSALQQGAKRDPELYILAAIMTGAFGLAGWYFGSKQTSANSEIKVTHAKAGMPWDHDDEDKMFKYKYHPGGDLSKAPKEAPSALHSVIVENVTLPKEMHERFNKWGKEGF